MCWLARLGLDVLPALAATAGTPTAAIPAVSRATPTAITGRPPARPARKCCNNPTTAGSRHLQRIRQVSPKYDEGSVSHRRPPRGHHPFIPPAQRLPLTVPAALRQVPGGCNPNHDAKLKPVGQRRPRDARPRHQHPGAAHSAPRSSAVPDRRPTARRSASRPGSAARYSSNVGVSTLSIMSSCYRRSRHPRDRKLIGRWLVVIARRKSGVTPGSCSRVLDASGPQFA